MARNYFQDKVDLSYLKGRAFEGLGDPAKAKASYQEGIKKDPTLPGILCGFGKLIFRTGKTYVYAALTYGDADKTGSCRYVHHGLNRDTVILKGVNGAEPPLHGKIYSIMIPIIKRSDLFCLKPIIY